MYQKTMAELEADGRETIIIDVRKAEDFEKESYPGALHIYWEDFMKHKEQIPKDKPVYLLGYTGQRSDEIAEALQKEGYEIYSIVGGFSAYAGHKLSQVICGEESLQERCKQAERSIVKKFRKEIWRPFTKAINEYELIKDGDKIAVCISGGKDSMIMAKLFQELARHGKKNFDVVYLVMNPGYNDINYETMQNY